MKPQVYQTAMEDRDAFREFVYTPIDKAVELLHERQSSSILDELEDGWLMDVPLKNVPNFLKQRGIAVITRNISTPNHELQRFLDLAEQYHLTPVIWEYHADKFVTRNPCKYALGRMGFYSGKGRNGGDKIAYTDVIDFNRCWGASICDIRTLWGQPLTDFHHELVCAEHPELGMDSFFDASQWFSEHGGTARHYYRHFLALFLQHAILFETFILQGEELKFTREVFLPAFYNVCKEYGLKPLITPIEPPEREGDPYWLMYPDHVREYVETLPDAAKSLVV